MKIFHYRNPDYDADPFEDMLIKDNTELSDFKSHTILSINGQTVLRQHSITYITGRETCNAHHFAKMLAGAVLKGSYDGFPGLSVNLHQARQGSVLWLDSVHSFHACVDLFEEMSAAFNPDYSRFSLLSVDRLGSFRYDFYSMISQFEKAVKEFKPTLIVVDDIDHLMPYCGINVASAFQHAIRDIINHTPTACLFIGYNHLGKRASTTGNLGKMLFPESYYIFSVTTQQAISTVKLVKGFFMQFNTEAPFHFSIGSDNLPHQVIRTMPEPADPDFIRQNTLRDIISEVIEPGQSISPDELFQQLNNRRQQLNRHNHTRALIAQAAQLGIINKTASNHYTFNPQSITPVVSEPAPSGPPCPDSVTAPTTPAVNNSLTLPPTPSSPDIS